MQRRVWPLSQKWFWASALVLSTVVSLTIASAAEAPSTVTLTLEQQRFSPAEIHVKANTPLVLTVTNQDAEEEEFEIAALRIEQILPGGKTLHMQLPARQPGTYKFVGEFHEETARGRLVAE